MLISTEKKCFLFSTPDFLFPLHLNLGLAAPVGTGEGGAILLSAAPAKMLETFFSAAEK